MIHVTPQPEPASFDSVVRQPGRNFLRRVRHPDQSQWRNHAYWKHVHNELYERYGKICAYSCHWIAPDTGFRTCEHFVAKDADPPRAYEWLNYRLVCGFLNGRKSDNDSVIDPFKVRDGWFELQFPSLIVQPGPTVSARIRKRVNDTIAVLKLNDDESCVAARTQYVGTYCDFVLDGGNENAAYLFLVKNAPFLAKEINRQGLRGRLPAVMSR